MAAQWASTCHCLCEQKTSCPWGWLSKPVACKVRICFRETLSQVSGLGVFSFPHSLLGVGSVASGIGKNADSLCPRSFFSYSMQRACHNHSFLVVFSCSCTSLPTAQWLRWEPELKQPLQWAGQEHRGSLAGEQQKEQNTLQDGKTIVWGQKWPDTEKRWSQSQAVDKRE